MNLVDYVENMNEILKSPVLRQTGKTEITSQIVEWKLKELLDRFITENIFKAYVYESTKAYVGGMEIGVDQELLTALKTVFDYFATDKEKEEFDLKFKNL
jgi:hypothetical protein